VAARIAGLADFVEVAYRMGGVDAARQVARRRRGKQFDPALADVVYDDGEMILSGLDDVGTWNAVIDAEPSLAVAVDAEQFEEALRAVANFVDLKSPYSLGHAIAVSTCQATPAGGWGCPRATWQPCVGPDSCTDSAGSASPTRSGTRPRRSAPASGSGCACTPI
jgi:hypothetical protein